MKGPWCLAGFFRWGAGGLGGSALEGPVKPAFDEFGGCGPGEENGQHGCQDRGGDGGEAQDLVEAGKGESQGDRNGQQGPGGAAGPERLAAADDEDHHAGGDDRLDTPWGSRFFPDKPACPA